eukprot:TRINITY_DN3671_c0_g1_i1.p1 TRINITY_DN3671_c0_g1~~TRINITY_DN3671_c0_g1_i1.p1  ORF type:complete len:496 (+),score=149.27 TRINITY_DN3671_c0_g1_i1:81-1568(+)
MGQWSGKPTHEKSFRSRINKWKDFSSVRDVRLSLEELELSSIRVRQAAESFFKALNDYLLLQFAPPGVYAQLGKYFSNVLLRMTGKDGEDKWRSGLDVLRDGLDSIVYYEREKVKAKKKLQSAEKELQKARKSYEQDIGTDREEEKAKRERLVATAERNVTNAQSVLHEIEGKCIEGRVQVINKSFVGHLEVEERLFMEHRGAWSVPYPQSFLQMERITGSEGDQNENIRLLKSVIASLARWKDQLTHSFQRRWALFYFFSNLVEEFPPNVAEVFQRDVGSVVDRVVQWDAQEGKSVSDPSGAAWTILLRLQESIDGWTQIIEKEKEFQESLNDIEIVKKGLDSVYKKRERLMRKRKGGEKMDRSLIELDAEIEGMEQDLASRRAACEDNAMILLKFKRKQIRRLIVDLRGFMIDFNQQFVNGVLSVLREAIRNCHIGVSMFSEVSLKDRESPSKVSKREESGSRIGDKGTKEEENSASGDDEDLSSPQPMQEAE